MHCLSENQLRRVLVVVRRVDGYLSSQAPGGLSQPIMNIVQYTDSDIVDGNLDEAPFLVEIGNRLRSEEWRELISGLGQRFPGGIVEFRKSLVKYWVQVGFEFHFVKNGPYKVTAEYKKKREMGCEWRIYATKGVADDGLYIKRYERNHKCGISFGNVSRKRVNSKIIMDLIVDIRVMPSIFHC